MTITAIPSLDRTSPTFRSDVDLFFGSQLPSFAAEANALQADVNAKQMSAAASAATATARAAEASDDAATASAAALTAVNAPGTLATSITSLTIGGGSMSLTIQSGKAYGAGQFIIIANTPATSNYMVGQITSHDSSTGSMTVNISIIGGGGTYAEWTISLTAAAAAPGMTIANVAGTSQLAVAGYHYALTSVATTTVTLPASPMQGDTVWVTIANGLTTNIIARNGQTIMSVAEDMIIDNANATVELRFVNSTWRLV